MNALSSDLIEALMLTAKEACEQGAFHAKSYFQSGLCVEQKTDDSPVTLADREAEERIITIIRSHFPEHSILGEEHGLLQGHPDFRWIIDPIDGTRGFIRGGGFWGSLVGVEYRGEMIAGAMCLPIPKLTYWAGKGLGCFRNGTRIQLEPRSTLDQATLSIGEIQYMLRGEHRAAISRLICACASTRGYGDPGGLMMVLEGLADIWIEAGVKTWDIAHAKILIEEAGGLFTDFAGESTIESGNCIATVPELHPQILDCFKDAYSCSHPG